jgi:hypothetical protein
VVLARAAALPLLLLAAACGGTGESGPTASASASPAGELVVRGVGWSTCGALVYVDPPGPWLGRSATVEADGSFELVLEPGEGRAAGETVTVQQSRCGRGVSRLRLRIEPG